MLSLTPRRAPPLPLEQVAVAIDLFRSGRGGAAAEVVALHHLGRASGVSALPVPKAAKARAARPQPRQRTSARIAAASQEAASQEAASQPSGQQAGRQPAR